MLLASDSRITAYLDPMNSRSLLIPILWLIAGLAASQETKEEPIDFDKARALLQKQRSGEKLDEAGQRYLERAKALRRKQQQQRNNNQRPANQRPAPERLIPLTDMGAKDRYEGETGGLYGDGTNEPPPALAKLAAEETAKIKPLDAGGTVDDEDGRIVFISISMSNATQEFSRFKQIADRSPQKSDRVTIVDCAQGGQAMAEWVAADARPWKVAMQRLAAAKVSPEQVQVAWVKLANKSPSGSLEEHGKKLEADTLKVLQNAKEKFPNLRLAYLGSRIWAGHARGRLNPEPYAYESAFVVRWLIQRQIKDDAVKQIDDSPLLLWGPYLWAEGPRGRKFDKLIWERKDFAGDGVHPSDSGRQKVAEQLLNFFTTSPQAKPWFTSP